MSKNQRIIASLLILIAVFAQVNFLSHFTIFGIKPNLLLALIVFVSLFLNKSFSLLAALLCGFAMDVFSYGLFGLNLASFVFINLFLQYNKKIVNTQDIRIVFLITAASFIAVYCLQYFLLGFNLELPGFFMTLKNVIIPSSIYTLIIFYLIYFSIGKQFKVT
jgi:rod shape-determining protein MreD